MLIKNKIFLWKRKTTAFWQNTAFTAFDDNHGFRDYLLSLTNSNIPVQSTAAKMAIGSMAVA